MYLTSVKNSKIYCSTWNLYLLGSVVSNLTVKLLSKLRLLLPSMFIKTKRKQECAYNDNYLQLRFTSVEANGEIRPHCVLC